MSFDKILDLTAGGVYSNFYNIYGLHFMNISEPSALFPQFSPIQLTVTIPTYLPVLTFSSLLE